MRDIRFRGKRLDTGEWVYGYLFQAENAWWIQEKPLENTFNDIQTFITGSEAVLRIVAYQVDPTTVGQYTGLKDKNGTEIFKGDVFATSTGIKATVEWEKEGRFLGFTTTGERRIIYINREPLVEIIGNIYENKELLEGVK